MPTRWTLGGLPLLELLRRTARESWQDEVFGQGGRMAFYHFLAIFPSLLVLLLAGSHIPHLGAAISQALLELSARILPPQVSRLLQRTMQELLSSPHRGLQLLSICAGALWASLNGTWAMIYGLNNAYEVQEHRSARRLAATIAGLTLSLVLAGAASLFLIFSSTSLQSHLHRGAALFRIFEWMVLAAALSLSFAVLYRFAPSLRDARWRWSTPGALCAVILWIGSSFAARFYFSRVNDYTRSYGHLNAVVMLLLWLYVTNGAILIGGEMNSEIEKSAASSPIASSHQDRSRRRG